MKATHDLELGIAVRALAPNTRAPNKRAPNTSAPFFCLVVLAFLIPLAGQAQTSYYTGNLPMVPSASDTVFPCDSNSIGAIRYNAGTAVFEGCNGVAWADIRNGAIATAAAPAGSVQFNSGGLLGGSANFFWDNVNGRLGIGTTTPLKDLSFGGLNNRQIYVEQTTTANAPGAALIMRAGGAASGSTDKPGGDLSLTAGTSTGVGESKIYFSAAAPFSSSGTSTNSPQRAALLTGGGFFQIANSGFYDSMTQAIGTTSPLILGGHQMFWYQQKAALRAGLIDDTAWDDANIGAGSAAFGYDNTASGQDSVALGSVNIASGDYSAAWGYSTTAAGTSSTALGQYVAAGDTANTNGMYSMAIGLTNTATAPQAKVTGNGSMGIFMGDQHGVNVSNNNVVAVMGGNTGFGTTTPGTALDVNGGVTMEPSTVTLTANNTVLATANRSYFRVTSDNTTATNRIFCFGAGTIGQIIIIEWTSSTNKGEIVKGGNCSGAGGAVAASIAYLVWAPAAAETILQLMYNGTHWIQIAGSSNK